MSDQASFVTRVADFNDFIGDIIRVLHIDDEDLFLNLTKYYLENKSNENLMVDTLTDPSKVKDYLKKKKYDVIVSDYLMSPLDGLEILEQLRTEEFDIPFIFFTGQSREEIAIKALNLGADYYIKKGIDIESQYAALIHTIKTVVKHKRIVEALKESELIEKALQESNEYYRSILENIEEGYYEVDIAGNFTFFNPSLIKTLDYPSYDIKGTNYTKFMDSNDSKQVFKIFNKVYRTGEPIKAFGFEIIRSDQTKRFIESSISPIKGKPGKITGFRGIVRDITERAIMEKAIKESNEYYRSILENIDEGYYEVDLAGNFTFFNPSLCRIHGYTAEELLGMNNREYMDEETAKHVYKVFNRVYRTSEPQKIFEWEIIRKDKTRRLLETSVSPIKGKSGEITGFRGIVRDKTDINK
ncbi:MAG: PAS domain S-box protein [Candidatus Hodarchaeales archaeon]|jgi:PAS domain S-box-containing protein